MAVSFEDLKLTRQFINALDDLGFSEPTEIQEKAIKPILGGQDVIGIAQTGTGKSAAYLLPLLQTIKYAQGIEPRALILVPTKELVIQVYTMLADLAKYTDIRFASVYGGVGPKTQIEQLNAGVDIIIATPGRLMELYFKGALLTKKIKFLVLDEADRMMEMGFMGQLRDVLEIIPRKRQNLLFSATFSEKVEELSFEFLERPTKIEVTKQASAVNTIVQTKVLVKNHMSKCNYLFKLINTEGFTRVLVFTKTKTIATELFKFLDRKTEFEIRCIHGNKSQNSRINAFNDFKEGNVRVLVCTDVAARGIDIPEVSHVINFDVPRHYEDYVHRIGRTGRARKIGESITFFHQADVYHVEKIEELIEEEIPLFTPPEDINTFFYLPEEEKGQLMEIDRQKRREDPDFKGAFHVKKKVMADKASKEKARRKRRR